MKNQAGTVTVEIGGKVQHFGMVLVNNESFWIDKLHHDTKQAALEAAQSVGEDHPYNHGFTFSGIEQ